MSQNPLNQIYEAEIISMNVKTKTILYKPTSEPEQQHIATPRIRLLHFAAYLANGSSKIRYRKKFPESDQMRYAVGTPPELEALRRSPIMNFNTIEGVDGNWADCEHRASVTLKAEEKRARQAQPEADA